MAVTMAPFWVFLVLSVIGAHASGSAGELSILHSPKSLQFSVHSNTLESFIKEIFSASLGLSVEENSEWEGLLITDPFNTPEAIVEVYIDGVSSVSNSGAFNFPLTVDEYEPDTYEALRHRIRQRFINGGNKLVNIRLSDPDELTAYPDVFGDISIPKVPKQSLQHLKPTLEEDLQFLAELEALKAITAKVQSGAVSADKVVDFFYFRFRSLHALSDIYGVDSLQTKEAKHLLNAALEKLTRAFVKAYDGSVLVTAVCTDVVHTRRTVRSAPTSRSAASVTPRTDDNYSEDYAAIFNIILWFGVVFAFSLVAIVYVMVDMDPGRDSIIYRMTSTRMKKDN